MLLDYIYPTEIAGPLHSGLAAFLSESTCGLLNPNHTLDMPDPCLPVEIDGDQGRKYLVSWPHYPVTPALRDGVVELSV